MRFQWSCPLLNVHNRWLIFSALLVTQVCFDLYVLSLKNVMVYKNYAVAGAEHRFVIFLGSADEQDLQREFGLPFGPFWVPRYLLCSGVWLSPKPRIDPFGSLGSKLFLNQMFQALLWKDLWLHGNSPFWLSQWRETMVEIRNYRDWSQSWSLPTSCCPSSSNWIPFLSSWTRSWRICPCGLSQEDFLLR